MRSPGLSANRNFRIPTTADVFGGSLYAVNARFDVAPPGGGAKGIEFEIVKVDKNYRRQDASTVHALKRWRSAISAGRLAT